MGVEKAKARIVAARSRRIREGTYLCVIAAILEDTAADAPFRDRMVIDWWSRVVDPLEAEQYDKERLRYFRERLREHNQAPPVNAAIRQGQRKGKLFRRLNPKRYLYVRHQIRRMTDPKLNYVAAAEAVARSDVAYEQLAEGFIGLQEFKINAKGRMQQLACGVIRDPRFKKVAERLSASGLDGMSDTKLAERLELIRNPFSVRWMVMPSSGTEMIIEELKERGLQRKLESIYINKTK